MSTLLVACFVLALVIIVVLVGVILWGAHACVTEHQSDHAKCVAHIASVTSNRVVALAFREAAARWDSIEEQADLQRLAREKFVPDVSPSMPALWLSEQADKLDPA